MTHGDISPKQRLRKWGLWLIMTGLMVAIAISLSLATHMPFPELGVIAGEPLAPLTPGPNCPALLTPGEVGVVWLYFTNKSDNPFTFHFQVYTNKTINNRPEYSSQIIDGLYKEITLAAHRSTVIAWIVEPSMLLPDEDFRVSPAGGYYSDAIIFDVVTDSELFDERYSLPWANKSDAGCFIFIRALPFGLKGWHLSILLMVLIIVDIMSLALLRIYRDVGFSTSMEPKRVLTRNLSAVAWRTGLLWLLCKSLWFVLFLFDTSGNAWQLGWTLFLSISGLCLVMLVGLVWSWQQQRKQQELPSL